jgi:hypothetical protein
MGNVQMQTSEPDVQQLLVELLPIDVLHGTAHLKMSSSSSL